MGTRVADTLAHGLVGSEGGGGTEALALAVGVSSTLSDAAIKRAES